MRVDMMGSEWFDSRPGGLNRYFEGLYGAMKPLADVRAAAFGRSNPDDESATSWGPLNRGTLSRIAASRSPQHRDAVEIIDRHFSLYGPSVHSYSNTPRHVIHFQGPWARESRAAGASRVASLTKRAVERLRYASADHLIVLSTSFKEILIEDYGVDENSVSVIPPGVDLSRFAWAEVDSAKPVVLCVRRLERRMGIHVLISAWDSVVDSVPGAELHIVGRGTYENELKDLAKRQRNSSSIVFRGHVNDDELRSAYVAATITVVPSVDLEGFGLIALESLAVGRAAVVTDCGGLPDAVRALDDSLIVPANSAEALADRLTRALDGERPTAQASRAHAESFAWSVVAQKHLRLYEGLVS